MFVCPECPGRSFVDANAVRMHRESKHYVLSYSCGKCSKAFSSQQALEQHDRDKHFSFECRYCDREFATENGRDAHENAKHHMFECRYCDREFSSEDAREQHENAKHLFECHYCDRDFNSDEARQQHENAKHSFECNYCDRNSHSERARQEHEDAVHATFECRYCNREFNSEGAREQHEDAKHSGFQCYHCSSKFPSEYARKQHEREKHHFECDICKKCFTLAGALWQHSRTSHFECNYCDSDHSTAALRKAHEASCPYNPANRITRSTLSDGTGSSSSSSPPLMEIVEEEPSSSTAAEHTDEEPEPSTSPSPSSQDEGEMFHSTSALPSAGANGGEAIVTQPRACSHSVDLDGCSICQSSSTRKIVPDDAVVVVCTGENPGNDSKDHRDVALRCTPCFRLFESEEAFRNHVCAFRTAMFRPHCPICYTQFDDAQSLQNHLEGLQALSCQLCLTRCCSDEMLQDHMLSHPTCARCGKGFADHFSLCAHLESDHPVMVCWDCDGIVVEQNSLELHYADSSAHPSCALCGVGKRSTAEMDEHVKVVHAGTAEMNDQPGGGDVNGSPDEGSALPEVQPSTVDQLGDAAQQPSEELDHVPLPSSVDSGGPFGGPGDEPSNTPPQTESSVYSSPQPSMTLQVESVDEVPKNPSFIDGDETTDAMHRYASPSPTPSEHGSDASRLQMHASKATITSTNSDTRPHSLASSVSAGSLSDLRSDADNSRSSPTSSGSNSVVFVSADGIPDYVRENRAILVATSAGSPSSGRTPLRLSSESSLASMDVPAGAGTEARTGGAYRLHCRICLRDPCEDMMATICGHLFCKKCITQAVVAKSECPVCGNATLLYCLFKLDLSV